MARSRASAKDAGTRFASWTADYLDEMLPGRVERRALSGAADRGDISGVATADGREVVVECKDYAGRYGGMLPGWLAEAERERANAEADLGVAVFKRGGCGRARMGDQFVCMTLKTFARLLGAAGEGDGDER